MPNAESDWDVDFCLTGRDGHALLVMSRLSKAILWNIESGQILQEMSTMFNDEVEDLGDIITFNPLQGIFVLWMFGKKIDLQVWKKNYTPGTFQCSLVIETDSDEDIEKGFQEDCFFGNFVRFEFFQEDGEVIFTPLSGDRPVRREITSNESKSIFYSPFVIATEHKSTIRVYDFFDVKKFSNYS